MALAAAGDTWGISGPTFLLGYLALAAVVWIAGRRTRRALTDVAAERPVGDLADRPHHVAYLNGGSDLAVLSALGAMRLSGSVSSVHGTVKASARIGPGDDELERAIHLATATPVHRRRLVFARPVGAALRSIESRLVAAGLLLTPEQRQRIRRVGGWMLAVALLGLVRLLAVIADAAAIAWLVVALLAVTAVAAAQLAIAPRRTRLGERTLIALRSAHHGLAPDLKPDWALYGPSGAALGIGLYGTSALWASDPALAHELAAQRAGGGVDGGGGGGGDGGGADGAGASTGGGGGSDGGGCGGGCGG